MLHLYLPFRTLVQAAIDQANRESAGKYPGFYRWGLFEGYRSVARQRWLYDHGKTPMAVPKRHGYGLAADIVWYDKAGRPHWDGPNSLWQILGHAVRSQKAFGQKCTWGGDWHSRDLVHMETGLLAYAAWKLLAARWLKAMGLTPP